MSCTTFTMDKLKLLEIKYVFFEILNCNCTNLDADVAKNTHSVFILKQKCCMYT